MSANYTPEKEDLKILTPFKMQVLTNFPYIEADFDALTNYQLLCKVVEYLNDTIAEMNEVTEQTESLYNSYVALQNYVNEEIASFEETVNGTVQDLENYMNNYFNNLDVQQEINNKLDSMALDGTLTNLIKGYVDPIYEAYEQQLNGEMTNFKNTVNTSISNINTKVDQATSGSPLVAASTDDMTETDRVYVNTTDGNWYYYDGDSWEIGGTYQSTGIADESISVNKLDDTMKNNVLFKQIDADSVTWFQNNIWAGSESINVAKTRISSDFILILDETTIEFDNTTYYSTINYYDLNHDYVKCLSGAPQDRASSTIAKEDTPCYIKITLAHDDDSEISISEGNSSNVEFTAYKPIVFNYKDIDFNIANSYVNESFINSFIQKRFYAPDRTFDWNRTRITFETPIKYNDDVYISINGGYKYTVVYWTTNDSSPENYVTENSGWRTGDFKIPANQYFTLVLAKSNDSYIYPYESINFTITKYLKASNLVDIINPTNIRVSTINVGHFSFGTATSPTYTNDDIKKFKEVFSNLNSDIILISEDNPTCDANNQLNTNTTLYSIFKYIKRGTKYGYNCNSIISKYEITNEKLTMYSTDLVDQDTRYYYEGDIKINGKSIHLIITQLSWQNAETRATQMQELITTANNYEYCIMAGDFNVDTNSSEYSIFTDANYKIANCGYFGVFNTWAGEGSSIKPIDNIITSPNIFINNIEVIDEYISDHYPVITNLTIY